MSDYHKRSDAELIGAHLAGDIAAWEVLLNRYERFIFRLILRADLTRADAEDIFQNVCLKLYLHLDDLRDVRRLTGWLTAVVSQEIIRWRRRAIQSVSAISLDSVLLAETPQQEPLPEEIVLAEERILLVQQALNSIDAPCFRLLSLLYRPGQATYSGAAESLGIPLGSVGPRRARCLERLKNILVAADF